MSFFESLLALLAVAIALLQVSRRLRIPYPTMLAAAGVCLALIPGTPQIPLDPQVALVLFVAPALVDAAFDFPATDVWRLWVPLFSLAVLAVLLSAGAVAWVGVAAAGMPFYAALTLGAIVAPPDAAAATAVLNTTRMPRGSVTVLKGESLLNDASALLIFSAASSLYQHHSNLATLGVKLAIAAPGGVLLGFVMAKFFRHVTPLLTGTLGGNLMEFVTTFGVWIIAQRLGLSPVLCLVAFAMTIARSAGRATRARMRIHSFAVWDTAVFLSNVLAFLLMGLQARTIVGDMAPDRLRQAAWFALGVIVCLTLVRLGWVLLYVQLGKRFPGLLADAQRVSLRHAVLIGWCGMRGLVTLATAFALPAGFPDRDLIVLCAFAVVLATLVVQGLTLSPLVRLLGLDGEDGLGDELAGVRADLAAAALETLEGQHGDAADHWRYSFETLRAALTPPGDAASLDAKRELGLVAIRRQRERLHELAAEGRVGPDAFLILQEEIDFREVSLGDEQDRRIEAN